MTVNIVWFKRDLRFTDNAPLELALKLDEPTLMMYLIEPKLLCNPHYRGRHWQFIGQSLEDLQHTAEAVGHRIEVLEGDAVDVGLTHPTTGKRIKSLMESADSMVFVSDRLRAGTEEHGIQTNKAYTIPCHSEMDDEWARPMKKWKGRWRREAIDILFPADPRRPEKNHYLALQTGEILEQRGWIVGMTTLKQQPRSIVWDRMIVADVTLITSHRESGPLVARESILCGTPVVSTNVGDLATYLPKECIIDVPTPEALADACEHALQADWESSPVILPQRVSAQTVGQQWSALLEGLEEEE